MSAFEVRLAFLFHYKQLSTISTIENITLNDYTFRFHHVLCDNIQLPERLPSVKCLIAIGKFLLKQLGKRNSCAAVVTYLVLSQFLKIGLLMSLWLSVILQTCAFCFCSFFFLGIFKAIFSSKFSDSTCALVCFNGVRLCGCVCERCFFCFSLFLFSRLIIVINCKSQSCSFSSYCFRFVIFILFSCCARLLFYEHLTRRAYTENRDCVCVCECVL